MSESMGFPGRRFQFYDDPYSSSEDTYRDSRRQRRLFAAYAQREAFMRAHHGQSSQFAGMPNFQSPFAGRGAPHSHMMGVYPQLGVPSPLGRNMGMGAMGSIGAMGRDPSISLGMGMGMAANMHCPNRSSFLGASQMGYRQSSMFSPGNSHRTRAPLSTRHQYRGQAPWPRGQRSAFSARPYSASFFSDDDDESDWDATTLHRQPRWRMHSLRSFGRSGYRTPSRSRWMYDEYDDEDDESDFEEYHPSRRERFRY